LSACFDFDKRLIKRPITFIAVDFSQWNIRNANTGFKIDKYGGALFGLKSKVFDFPVPLTKVNGNE